MIAQLSALSQRHKALDKAEEDVSVESTTAEQRQGSTETAGVGLEPHSLALDRNSPRLAALRVSYTLASTTVMLRTQQIIQMHGRSRLYRMHM